MYIDMDRAGDEPQLDKFVKRMKDNEGNPIGMAQKHSILDTRVYEIESKIDSVSQCLITSYLTTSLLKPNKRVEGTS